MKDKQKILFIVTTSVLGGVAKYLLELTYRLPKDVMPYFVMGSEGYLSEELNNIGVSYEQMFFVSMTNNIFDIFQHLNSILKILRVIKKIKPDIIHCNATTGAVVGAICGLFTQVKTIYTVHGWPFTDGISKNKQIFYKFLEFLICFVFKKIICVSEYDRKIGAKTLPVYKSKMLTIHNGISDVAESCRKIKFSNNLLKIIMVSRFCQQKDPYTLIFAVHELLKEGYNIQLDLYGYGQDLDKVLNCIKIQHDENIRYKGEISNVIPVLKGYDVYALISNWEGLPIGIIEAMRAGLPILASDVGGNSELIKNNGYLVKRNDVMDCRNKIKILYENMSNLQNLGQNSRKFYEDEFVVQKMTNKTFEVIKEL